MARKIVTSAVLALTAVALVGGGASSAFAGTPTKGGNQTAQSTTETTADSRFDGDHPSHAAVEELRQQAAEAGYPSLGHLVADAHPDADVTSFGGQDYAGAVTKSTLDNLVNSDAWQDAKDFLNSPVSKDAERWAQP
ncbi:hypothetical protein [Streptomyces sp. ODS05-4]|uniref:hypothetical protein n=1 Tax=Streptomyces sp. ODS05-4 TaxID=2944939 RepID=UPI00210A58A7|nr:hypothetical protein [Streptomyces sp. ODS05-4]